MPVAVSSAQRISRGKKRENGLLFGWFTLKGTPKPQRKWKERTLVFGLSSLKGNPSQKKVQKRAESTGQLGPAKRMALPAPRFQHLERQPRPARTVRALQAEEVLGEGGPVYAEMVAFLLLPQQKVRLFLPVKRKHEGNLLLVKRKYEGDLFLVKRTYETNCLLVKRKYEGNPKSKV